MENDLCLKPAPEQHVMAERSNGNDRPVKHRPPNPVCIRPAGHEQDNPWHHAGYGIPEWQDAPAMIREDHQ